MRLTRRTFLTGLAAGAASAGGLYELVDRLTAAPKRPRAARALGPEQHLLEGLKVVTDDGIEVIVPALHHEVVTATLKVDQNRDALRKAQTDLEETLASLDDRFEPTPAGLGFTVAWGRPYFDRFVPGPAREHIPLDLRASKARRKATPALLDAIRFPSDPGETVLEANDVAVLLRSDSRANIAAAHKALFDDLDVFEKTSIRRGFAGGGFAGGQSLPKQMATAAGVPGADLIPDTAELFLGFTSTQKANLGPTRIANLETLGYTHRGYFSAGTHMHLSHIFEDLETWYLNFDFGERVATVFRPGLRVKEDAQTVAQPARTAENQKEVVRDFRNHGTIGHSGSIQTTSRLERAVVGADGTVYARGTAIPQRADFNTLDNPFAWSADPVRDGMLAQPAAGVHFVVFNPTSDDFHRNRLAMDGVLPDGTKLPLPPRGRGQGLNFVLRTTHRQNFLVPPRRHRSFPLAELLT
jgi:hypothetical protein